VADDDFGDYEFFLNAGFKWSFHKHHPPRVRWITKAVAKARGRAASDRNSRSEP
jgi:hypothetical protein